MAVQTNDEIKGTEKEFLDLFNHLCYSRTAWQVWSDLMSAMACTIANPVVGSVLQPDEQKGQEFWYTPLYYSNRWQMRIFIQNMKRLMPLPEAEQQKEDEYVFFFDFDKKEETYGNK